MRPGGDLDSIPRCLAVFAGFAGADIDALAVVHLDFDRLITAVAADVETNVVTLFLSSRTVS